MSMSHRERVLAALEHREADRVPVDFGGTFVTTTTAAAYERLKAYLGIEAEARIINKMLQTVLVDEAIQLRFDTDVRPLYLRPPEGWKDEFMEPDGYRDEWRVERQRLSGTYYYDLVGSPLRDCEQVEALEDFPWPNPEDAGRFRGLREEAERLRETTDFAIVFHANFTFFLMASLLRGFDKIYADLVVNRPLAEAIMDRVSEINLRIAEIGVKEVGDLIDLVVVTDDMGTQLGPYMSPSMYRELIKPRFAHGISEIKKLTPARVFYHVCGSVYDIIEDFIDAGVDVLNPVQVSAAKMDTARLKKEFGDRLVFWGGVDSQRVLPLGSPEEVRAEVRRRVDDLAPGGGFVLAAVHNIQPEVPPENVCAMLEEALEYGRYGRVPA